MMSREDGKVSAIPSVSCCAVLPHLLARLLLTSLRFAEQTRSRSVKAVKTSL